MPNLCKTCGQPLELDSFTGRMLCTACGSSFRKEDFDDVDLAAAELEDAPLEPAPAEAPVLAETAASPAFVSDATLDEEHSFASGEAPAEMSRATVDLTDTAREYIESNLYACGNCGGTFAFHGGEEPAGCVYCGSSDVVMQKTVKQERPEFILPFRISRNEAAQKINETFVNVPFAPKELRKVAASSLQGLYVPYWIVDAKISETMVIRWTSSQGGSAYHLGVSGTLDLKNFPIEASKDLADSISEKLEPFDFEDLNLFDEKYLEGCYSTASDITYGDLDDQAKIRTKKVFEQLALQQCSSSEKIIKSSFCNTAVDPDVKYALLPVWVASYEYEGETHTILLNGTTGRKVVCGLPMKRKSFAMTVVLASILASILASGLGFLLCKVFNLPILFMLGVTVAFSYCMYTFTDDSFSNSSVSKPTRIAFCSILVLLVLVVGMVKEKATVSSMFILTPMLGVIMMYYGIRKIRKHMSYQKQMKAANPFAFMNKRKEK